MLKTFFLFLICLVLGNLTSLTVHAAGPILVDTDETGQPVLWPGGVIHFNVESGAGGTLGSLSNDAAVTLVRELFGEWQNVSLDGGGPTVNISMEEGAGLGAVDLSNLDQHFTYCPPDETCNSEDSPFILGSARTGESPILFDDDGSMTDAVQGQGASESILGFAGPRVVEDVDGVLAITEGQAILNGRFVNGTDTSSDPEVTIDQFKGAIIHELGHFMGLDHTQVNLASVIKYFNGDTSEKDGIPTMFPLFVDGDAQLSLHFDDKVAISMLYPSARFQDEFCTIAGNTFESNGTTEMQGVNVVARNADDPLLEATSFVSGSYFTGSASGCNTAAGDFVLSGLIPGHSYELNIEKISQAFTGGSSVEPCDPPQSGFAAAALPGIFSCSSGGQEVTAGSETTTSIVTTKASSTTTPTPQSQASSSGGGCSLILF